jgi:uncharacterized protein YprB with RNaseH-like and TPR domain
LKAPLHRLKKTEIVWLGNHFCRHKHTYLTHYNCYLKENPDATEKIGYFDIEASNLDADFGIMLSYCIKDGQSDNILEGVLTPEDIQSAPAGQEDTKLVTKCIKDLLSFDKIVTFYGVRYDLPYVRTRALVDGVDFPNYGSIVHKDIYFMIRAKFKLSSNRLENACRVILGHTDKTRVDAKYWRGGMRGDQDSLDYILDHNRKDVLDLEALYKKVIDFGRPTQASI